MARPSIIKEIADAQGVRYQWVAAQMGVSEFVFYNVEIGRSPAPPGYYEAAARVLRVPVRLLLPDAAREPVPVS